ncbi:response regulator [Paenibacillus cremeus]|uniref:Response regulator n=1 Tax=Paenibacillus cremeus TaxID=2163881 RepID=A0A559JPV0_9BACL|nr:response regulator [Paenibacillus cremeus]TVY01914.1 response regulator [Paenibacillus cremeus]
MYKFILAEDEEDVRESILQEIDWAALGYEVVGQAENGQEALELIERQLPDVVVTDIQMPFMDGLQLSEIIRDKYPTMKIIILTGFDEFEYAQKAVKLHIDEYVLKPFSSQELIDVLNKVKSQLDAEIAEKENVQILQEHYRKSIPVLREVFLASLLTRKLSRTEIDEKAANYQLDLSGSSFIVSVLSSDPEHPEDTSARTGSLTYSKDAELTQFAVLNIAEEIVAKHRLGLVYLHGNEVVVLTLSTDQQPEAVMKSTLAVLEEIRQSIEKYLKLTITIGVGTTASRITDVMYSYQDAVLALDYRLILGSNRVICIYDVERRFVEKLRFDELKEHALIRCLKVGTAAELQDIVKELFQEVEGAQVSFKDFQIYLLEILTAILKAAKDADIDMEETFGESFHPFSEMYQLTGLHEAQQWIAQLCTKIMTSIASNRQSSYKTLVEQAKDFTKEHYHETDITINKVCSQLHISAGYFSSIFKKETKMTFVAYLMHIRMEAAKELLRTTDLKAFEISEQVGYADPNYFSFSFRKHVGVSPKEYRNVAREG